MSDLQALLKKFSTGVVSTMSYVYYNKENGNIHKISSKNIPEEGSAIFEVDSEEVLPILSGQRRTEEFTITYDVSLKQIRLKEVAYDDSHNTAATMNYQLPIIKNTFDGHISLEHVYEGVEVYMYHSTHAYSKGHCIWNNNNIYKLTTDILANTQFDIASHKIFVEDVLITDLPTQNQSAEKIAMQPEYVGIHVDVWYKELSHLAGQHVWLNGIVYKMLNDQDVDTEFAIDNVEVIVKNVKLYNDKNKNLEFNDLLTIGDMLLDNNQLYSVVVILDDFNKDKTSIFFFNSANTLMYYNNENVIKIDLLSIQEKVEYEDLKLNLIKTSDLKNGQIILSGKQLYQAQTEKDYDIIVQQNTQNKTWSMIINPYTKKFLQTSGYRSNETLYFSVTAKYDPNVLYRSLEFTVSDLLADNDCVIPFKTEAEADPKNVSIYTAKYFDSYAHEVI